MRAPQPGEAVRLSGLAKRWAGASALDGVSIDIAAGAFCVLLGPSGCGKTTLLRIIAGLETADGGQVEIGGRDVTHLPPAERGLAMVFQSYALFPHLSVAENILFGLKARRVPKAEQMARLSQAAGLLGLASLLGRRPGQLSGGQQQRVALGRAIVAQTRVCLMDEPLSNLDAQLRAEMRREIHTLQRRLAMTMIYVTHDQTEAMAMADQVVLLRAGRVEADATPAALYATPNSAFTAGFIGTPPMNLLRRDGLPGLDLPASASLVGLRPEALGLGPAGLPARVRHVEYLGAETIVECVVAGQRVLARLPGQVRLEQGAAVHLDFDQTDLHLFDDAGSRLPVPQSHKEAACA